jgi:MHS family proline/betaine transporter-like MFS transporter
MKDKLSKQVLISCFLAACLELYDFTIFGFFAPILHKNYLTFLSADDALIITYALFAVGFLFRPLGSILFGYIGDIYGRKRALVLSVTLMGVASLSMALLPTYGAIGVTSCYLIAVIRALQGISVGGEYSGALIYAIEHFSKKSAGIIGSIVIAGCMTGMLVATLVTNLLKMPFIPDYGWRLAFLLGFALAIVGYFIRKQLVETPEFKKLTLNRKKIPLLEGMKKHTMECVSTFFVAAANGVNFYFILVFLPGYINKLTNLNFGYYPLLSTALLIILSPILGYVSDKFDRTKIIRYGLITISIYSFVGLQLLSIYPSFIMAIIFFCGHAFIFSTQASLINIFAIEIFPPEYRFSCSSFFFSLGMGVIGGTSPVISAWIVENFANPTLLLSCYVAAISFLAYISMLFIKHKVNRG